MVQELSKAERTKAAIIVSAIPESAPTPTAQVPVISVVEEKSLLVLQTASKAEITDADSTVTATPVTVKEVIPTPIVIIETPIPKVPVIATVERECVPIEHKPSETEKNIVKNTEESDCLITPRSQSNYLALSEERANAVVDALLAAEEKIGTLLEKLPTSMSRIWELEQKLEALTDTVAAHFSDVGGEDVDQVGLDLDHDHDLPITDDKISHHSSVPVPSTVNIVEDATKSCAEASLPLLTSTTGGDVVSSHDINPRNMTVESDIDMDAATVTSQGTPVFARVRISQIIPLPEVSAISDDGTSNSAVYGIVRLSQIYPLKDEEGVQDTISGAHTDTDGDVKSMVDNDQLRMSVGSNVSDIGFESVLRDAASQRLSDLSAVTDVEDDEDEEHGRDMVIDLTTSCKSKLSYGSYDDDVIGHLVEDVELDLCDEAEDPQSTWKSSHVCSGDESHLTDPMVLVRQMAQISPNSCLSSNAGFMLGFPSNASASTDFDDATFFVEANDDCITEKATNNLNATIKDAIKPSETFNPDNDNDNDTDTTCNNTACGEAEDISVVGQFAEEESDDETEHVDYHFDPVRNKKFVYLKYIGHIFENRNSPRTPTKGELHGRLFRTYMISGVVRMKGKRQLYFIYYDVKLYPRGPPSRKVVDAWTLCPCRHLISQNHTYNLK